MNKLVLCVVMCLAMVLTGCGSSDTTIKIVDSNYGAASATTRIVGSGPGSQNLLADLSNLSADGLPEYEVADMATAAAALGLGKMFRNASGAVYITIE